MRVKLWSAVAAGVSVVVAGASVVWVGACATHVSDFVLAKLVGSFAGFLQTQV